MKQTGVYVYTGDRAELGMVEGIVDRLIEIKIFERNWRRARIVLVPGDRREAVRFAMTAFEAGKEIWHLGAGDECSGDAYHYDGTYRRILSQIANASGGKTLGLRDGAKADFIVGPTMVK